MVCLTAPTIGDAKKLLRPGSLLLEVGPAQSIADTKVTLGWNVPSMRSLRVLAVGSPTQVQGHQAFKDALKCTFSDQAIIPGIVNAHTHLDLTHVGYQPPFPETDVSLSKETIYERYQHVFQSFISLVRQRRAIDANTIADSVRLGIAQSLAGGVVAVGDISGAVLGKPSAIAIQTLAESGLGGVGFLEYFAIGATEDFSRSRMQAAVNEVVTSSYAAHAGLSPHAINTIGPASLAHALQVASLHGLTLCTHVAETLDERQFVAQCQGPCRVLLEELGIWSHGLEAEFGQGLTPIAHFAAAIANVRITNPVRWLLVHCNDVSDADLVVLEQLAHRARAGIGPDITLVYCPRASAYFGAPALMGQHKYVDIMSLGIDVALGTDSIINLAPVSARSKDATTALPNTTSVLTPIYDARLLQSRDGLDPMKAIAMMTTLGARALGLDENSYIFAEGNILAGVVGVELDEFSAAPQLLLRGNNSCQTRKITNLHT